jgi:hypothetical protein
VNETTRIPRGPVADFLSFDAFVARAYEADSYEALEAALHYAERQAHRFAAETREESP